MNKRDIGRSHRQLEKRHHAIWQELEDHDEARQQWAVGTCPFKAGDMVEYAPRLYVGTRPFNRGIVHFVEFGFRCKWVIRIRPALRDGTGYLKRPVILRGIEGLKFIGRAGR